MSNRFSKAALLTGSFAAGASLALPSYANAQEVVEEEEELIVVTGSRIQRKNVETAAPIAVVSGEEFELSGNVNVENVVNTLPQVVPGFTSNSNNPGTGTATANLRGLGTSRTMVLVNGRRWMFYDTSQIVDLNTIPAFVTGNVDVVTGGQSAVYGSDALAGVVNFVTRHAEGVELGAQSSITGEGDGARYELHGAIGGEFADGRGNATVYAEYYKRKPIFQGQRGFSEYALGGETFDDDLQQFGSSTLPNGVIRYFGDGNRAGTDFAANNAVVFDNVPGDFRTRRGDTYNYAPVNYLQIPQTRYLFGAFADYEITDKIAAYTELSFVNNRVAQELAATPVTGTFTVNLATIQPFLNPADFAQLQQLNNTETDGDPDNISLFLQRRTIETGARNSLDERNAFRVLGGFKGDINDYLNWDAYYMYARTRNSNVQDGNISRSAFQAGLDGTADPINIFGPNTLTPDMVDAISIQAQNGDISTIQVLNAYLSGTFGDFAIGGADPIAFAAGFEYRKLGSRFIPDTALSSGDVIGFNAGEATEGSYSVKELYGELILPVFDNGEGLRFQLNGAGRYSDYSNIGGVWSYAGGAEFNFTDGFKLRGQYQRAVRAPNVGELFGGQSIGFPSATDPCSVAAAASPGALRDLCIANGVSAAQVGTSAIQLNAQIPALFGGNPDLQEEVSDSYTFGIVAQPDFLPGFTLTVDYFDIKIENAINTIGLSTAFDLCFNQVQDPNDIVCAPFFANGPIRQGGVITTANPPSLIEQNIANLRTKGVDVQLQFVTDLGFSAFTGSGSSKLNLGGFFTYTKQGDFTPTPVSDVVTCAGEFGNECGTPRPKYKWTARATWLDGPFTLSALWRHVGKVHDDDPNTDYTAWNGIETIDNYDLMDLTFGWDFNEKMNLTFGIKNVFNTLPGTPTFDANGYVSNRPNSLLLGDNQQQANTWPSVYDVLGRDFFVSVGLKF